MTDDFEESLRETLANSVPTPPVEPDRAGGARAYSRRLRRVRAAMAVGAVSVVAAAAIILPSVLTSPAAHVAGPGPRTPVTGTPPAGGPACPPVRREVKATIVAAVPENAVAARLCVSAKAGPVWTPREPLVTGLGDLAQTVNALPAATPHGCIPEGSLPRYQLVFQYAGGHQVIVTGDLGCGYVDIGRSSRDGAEDVLQGYLGRIAEQRQNYAPPPAGAPAEACTRGFQAPLTAQFVVDGSALSLRAAQFCVVSNYVGGQDRQAGLLTPAVIRMLNSEFASHRSRTVPNDPRVTACLSVRGGGIPTYEITGTSAWGDPVQLAGTCAAFSYTDRDGRWYWIPSLALLTALESTTHSTGELAGRLLAVGGPAGIPPRPLSGDVTLSTNGQVAASLTVGPDGRFSASLQPGRYKVVGHSPAYNDGKAACQPAHPYVTVRAGETVHVSVLCQEK